MRFPLGFARLHGFSDHMKFPSAETDTILDTTSDIALCRLGFGPQIRSSVHQLHCAKCATAHRAHTKGWPLRTLLVLKTTKATSCSTCAAYLWLCRAHDGVHCRGSGQRQARGARRPLTYTSSIDVFLALWEHRRLSLPWCVWRVDGECNLTDDFVNGYLEAVAPAAPKPQGSLLQSFDGLEGGPRVAECNTTWSA